MTISYHRPYIDIDAENSPSLIKIILHTIKKLKAGDIFKAVIML